MGFEISSWFGLGKGRLTILLSATISTECGPSLSSIRFRCEGGDKSDTLQTVASEKELQNLTSCYAPKLTIGVFIGRNQIVTCTLQPAQNDRKTNIVQGGRPSCSTTG